MSIEPTLVRYFALLIAELALSGCMVSPPTNEEWQKATFGPEPEGVLQATRLWLHENLVDPDSVTHLAIEKPQKTWFTRRLGRMYGWSWRVQYNAKNRMGGYVGIQPHLFWQHSDGFSGIITPRPDGFPEGPFWTPAYGRHPNQRGIFTVEPWTEFLLNEDPILRGDFERATGQAPASQGVKNSAAASNTPTSQTEGVGLPSQGGVREKSTAQDKAR